MGTLSDRVRALVTGLKRFTEDDSARRKRAREQHLPHRSTELDRATREQFISVRRELASMGYLDPSHEDFDLARPGLAIFRVIRRLEVLADRLEVGGPATREDMRSRLL